jgi:hypothetical protein
MTTQSMESQTEMNECPSAAPNCWRSGWGKANSLAVPTSQVQSHGVRSPRVGSAACDFSGTPEKPGARLASEPSLLRLGPRAGSL